MQVVAILRTRSFLHKSRFAVPDSSVPETGSSRDLARRIAARDAAAESELWTRYSRGLLFIARRRTGDDELAQDIVQEAFRVALVRLREGVLENPDALGAFLRGVMLNVSFAMQRDRMRETPVADVELNVGEAASERQTPFEHTYQEERRALVQQVIGELPTARDRRLLWSYYVADEDKASICAQLQLSTEHFDRVLHRARKRFRALLTAFAGGGDMENHS